MAVALEFIDLIVRIDAIRERYPGGLDRCLLDHAAAINGRVWYDTHLFRDGTMSPGDMAHLVEEWERMGFVGHITVDGEEQWQDFCVTESLFGRATRRCDWLTVNDGVAWFNGTDPENVVGRGSMDEELARLAKLAMPRRR